MKILLLGKNGLLGKEIVSIFKQDEKHNFFALGREDVDITDFEVVYQTLKDIKPNLLINAAAFTYVDECETKRQFVMDVNGKANGNLAMICNKINAHLMYFSTDYVFDGTKEGGYIEDDIPSPINTYGESKLLGEKLIQQNTDKYFIIRTSWLFGMHGRNFVKTMLDKSRSEEKITVVNDQTGKPTYTYDLAKGIYNFIKGGDSKSGIYHLVNEGETTWFNFAKKIFENAHIAVQLIPVSTKELDREAKRPLNCVLNNTKLPHLRHHETALKDYINKLI